MVGSVHTPSIVNALAMALLHDMVRRSEERAQAVKMSTRRCGTLDMAPMSDAEMADAFAEVMGDE